MTAPRARTHRSLVKSDLIRRLLFACTLGMAGSAWAATLAVEGGRWFDGERFVPGTWFVVDGKLTRQRPAQVDVRIDARGAHVVPPYADAHNHDMQNAWGVDRRLTATLQGGVFYTAQLCANEDIEPFRPLFNRPTTPDVVVANACISASDGHPLGLLLPHAGDKPDLDALRQAYVAIDTEAQLAQRWPEVLARKPDLVKVILVDSTRHATRFGQPALLGRNGLDPALLPAIVQRAHAAGLRVAAHVDTAGDVAVAARAGVDLLAHLPGYHFEKGLSAADYRIDDDTVRLLAGRKIPVIATASVSATMAGLKGEALAAVQQVQRDNLQRLLRAGVPLLIGSDNPFGGPVDEVAYLDGLQLLPRAQLLRSLTMDTPRQLYPQRAIGRFAEGAEASFLLLDGNPLTDLQALRRIRLGVKQGSVLALPAPKP